MYDKNRYITVTGIHVPGTPRQIEKRGTALRRLYEEVFGDDGEEEATQDDNGALAAEDLQSSPGP